MLSFQYKTTMSHVAMMTSQWRASRLPWKERNAAVGLSTLLLFLPACKQSIPMWKRRLLAVQACVAFLSDYVYSGRPHISHGLDRWGITLTALACAQRAARSDLACVPLACYMMSMESIRLKHKAAYELWHTMWHVTGALCLWQ